MVIAFLTEVYGGERVSKDFFISSLYNLLDLIYETLFSEVGKKA